MSKNVLVAFLAVTLLTTGFGPAEAGEPDRLEVAAASVEELVGVDTAPSEIGETLTSETPVVVVDVQIDEGALVDVEPRDGAVASDGIAIEALDASSVVGTTNGMAHFDNEDGESSTLMQPLDDGVRIVTVLDGSASAEEYVFEFDAGSALTPTFFEDGALVLIDVHGVQRGLVEPPWALDALNRPVPTWYEWRGDDELVQVVDHLAGDFEYPIIADPTWTYSMDAIGTLEGGALIEGVTYQAAIKELKRCFNCSFPISGAGKTYPSFGQAIDLNASQFSFVKVPAPVKVAASGTDGFTFSADAGHFDGQYSTISFRFYTWTTGGKSVLRLVVKASVRKDRGRVQNAVNASFAKQQWQKFVIATACNARVNQGGRKC